MTKDSILAALPTLSLEELTIVHAVANQLIGAATGAQNKPGSTLAAISFTALSAALSLSTGYASVASTKWGKMYEKKLPDLAKWLDSNFPGWAANKVGQIAFLRMLFGLLAEDLKQRGLPRSFGVAVTNFDRIPKVFENAFPNYIEAGLGKLILKNFQ